MLRAMFSGRMEVLTDSEGRLLLLSRFLRFGIPKSFVPRRLDTDRPLRQALWNYTEFPEGRHCPFTGEYKRNGRTPRRG